MNGFMDRLFPASPMIGLLGDDQQQQALQQSRQQGLLGLAAGLLQAGGPSRTRTNIGQAIGSGLLAGQQMYQKALDQQLQGQLTMEKVGEARRQREQQAIARQLMPQLVQQGAPTVEGMQFPVTRDDDGNVLPGVAPGAMQINQVAANTLRSLLPPADFAKVMDSIKTQFEIGKAPEPKTITLGEGQQAYSIGPDGVARPIATGAPKREPVSARVQEAMQVLGISVPVNQLSPEQRNQIDKYIKDRDAAAAPKIAVDLKDPTAVANSQSKLINDWRGVLKDVGAFEIADRYASAVSAVQQGNAGNKAADGALIYAIGKIYDPSGAVQEGDKETILGNRSVPDSIKAYAQKVFGGGSLLESERNNLLAVVTQQVRAREQSIERAKTPYVSISSALGGDGSLLQNPISGVLQSLPQPQQASPISDIQRIAREEQARRKRGQ